MIVGEATTTVTVPPSEVFEFVLDLNLYRQADRKIGRVGPAHRTGDGGTVTFSGRIKGLPGPAGTYPFTATASHLQFGSPIAGPARWFLDFEGTFDCEVTAVIPGMQADAAAAFSDLVFLDTDIETTGDSREKDRT